VESLAKDPTDRAGCPGDEDTVHTSLPLLCTRFSRQGYGRLPLPCSR
jgi:hypothetical protein